jgi:drug/metabolite transporter (DMT)-like permease
VKLTQWQKGLAFAILAPLLYTVKSVGIKFAPPAKVEFFVFFRFVFDFLLLTPFFILQRDKLRSKRLPLHLVRAIFVAISIYCSVYGIRHLALVDAVLLENTGVLFIPLVAWAWHRQKITAYYFFILALGFLAVFFLLKPKLDILHLASFASIGTGLAVSITTVSISKLSKTDHLLAILFYFNLFSGALSLIPCLYTWESTPTMASFSFWLPFLLISFFGVLSQYAMIKAYSLIPPHVAGNFAYFGVLFSAFFGWLLWEESLSGMQVLGGGLLIGTGLLMIRKNQLRTSIEKTVLAAKDE